MDITLGIFKNTPTSLEMKDTNQGADLDRYFGPVVSSLEQIIVQVWIVVQKKFTERAANKNSSNKDNKPCSW